MSTTPEKINLDSVASFIRLKSKKLQQKRKELNEEFFQGNNGKIHELHNLTLKETENTFLKKTAEEFIENFEISAENFNKKIIKNKDTNHYFIKNLKGQQNILFYQDVIKAQKTKKPTIRESFEKILKIYKQNPENTGADTEIETSSDEESQSPKPQPTQGTQLQQSQQNITAPIA